MKKSTLVDILEHLAKAHVMAENLQEFLPPSSKERRQAEVAKWNASCALDVVREELKR